MKFNFYFFTKTWELRKLNDVVSVTMGQSPKSSNYTNNPKDYILVQGNTDIVDGWVKPRIWTKQITKSAKKGSTLLSVRAPVGDVSSTNYDIVIGRGIAALSENSFIFQLLKKIKSSGYWNKLTTGSTFESINSDDIKNLNFYIPFNIAEQKKVSDLLSLIDNSVALQQRQLDSYNKLKKGLLQKLFPKDGERVPEVRFADFHEDWEQRKLKDLANVIGGGTPSTKIGEYWNGDIDWYSPVEIGKSIFVNHSQKRITKLGLNKSSAKILPINTLLFTSRAGIGNTAILKKEGTTNQGFQSIVPIKDKLDIYYLYSNSDKLKRYGERVGGGSTFTEVSGKQMKEMPITIPTIHEQKNIGHIFQLLDFQILLQENNLKKLKQLKKFLLQKLFI
ncbi:restriction endonuclease subunit S [Companilactobacillus farciminis]|nr:restriction endonuclease subunit S [Companilactobacillus farciminis]